VFTLVLGHSEKSKTWGGRNSKREIEWKESPAIREKHSAERGEKTPLTGLNENQGKGKRPIETAISTARTIESETFIAGVRSK